MSRQMTVREHLVEAYYRYADKANRNPAHGGNYPHEKVLSIDEYLNKPRYSLADIERGINRIGFEVNVGESPIDEGAERITVDFRITAHGDIKYWVNDFSGHKRRIAEVLEHEVRETLLLKLLAKEDKN